MKYYKNPETLKKLYCRERLSIRQIAEKFDSYPQIIRYWLVKFKIPLKSEKERFKVSKNFLQFLYLTKKLSIRKIAKILKTTYATARNKLIKYEIPLRTVSEANMKYSKIPFSGDLKEKAYMLGIRTGDISVAKNAKQLTIRTSTTHPAQLDMFTKTFRKYSHINIYLSKIPLGKAWQIYCNVDNSFNFLLKKLARIPDYILNNPQIFYSFLAGYADCEATWTIIKRGHDNIRFSFRIFSGDKKILEQIKSELEFLGFRPILFLEAKKGYRKTFGKYNKNMFSLRILYQEDVIKLANILMNLSKHQEKIYKMQLILDNKDSKWDEIENRIIKFRKTIKESRLNNNRGTPRMPRYARTNIDRENLF